MTPTYFYVLPDLATLTELTGIEEGQDYLGEIGLGHLGQDPRRIVGWSEDYRTPITAVQPGYHLNATAQIEALAAYEVHPSAPMQMFM